MVRRAAVAVVLRDVGELQVLLVKRKERLGDPWSGQIALPGGMQKGSERLLQTAIRETREETGISLSINEVLGTLEPTYPKNAPGIEVIPFIFFLSKEMELRPGDEIEFCRWIPLAKILSNAAEIKLPGKGRVSAFIFENMVIWGMTHGILLDLWRFLEELGLN